MDLAVPVRRATGVVLVGATVVLLRPGSAMSRRLRTPLLRTGRQLQYLSGRLQGMSYRVAGRHPDLDVADDVLADRVRSSIGMTEKALDLPRVHVMVEDHVALLHGEVDTDAAAYEVERAVAEVPGVLGVESYLHVGLLTSDTRPSTGRAVRQPSRALTRLVGAASDAGIAPESSIAITRAVLATFADRLPAGERAQLAAHLPADVRELLAPPRRAVRGGLPRRAHELVERVATAAGDLPAETAERATAAVLACLRTLVPEEADDVRAVLPRELKTLWDSPARG